MLLEVYDNSSNLVAGPYTVTLGNTSTVNFNFTAAATQHQIRITNVNGSSYFDYIYVTAFNVWENILVPDNYTITQLTVKETQYIAVPDVFKLSNLSVTATPYPDVAYIHQLNVSYAKPYTRPLCANNNDKLTDINKQTRGFNGMERDDEVYGDGNSYDFGARMYDSRLGRLLSVDPMADATPHESPFCGMGNNPMYFVDPDGKFKIPIHNTITEAAFKKSGLSSGLGGFFKDDVILGVTYMADIAGAGFDWHFDGKQNYTQVQSTWNDLNKKIDNKIGDLGSFNKSFGGYDAVEMGKLLHTVQDFYSHSNYVELYIEYYKKGHDGKMPLSVPTYDEGVKDAEFNRLLEQKLRTGDFNLIDNEKTNPNGKKAQASSCRVFTLLPISI